MPTLRSSPRRSAEAGCRLTASAEAADLESVDDGVGRGVVVGVVGEALVDAEVVRAVVRAADHLHELLVMRDHDELEVGLLLARLDDVIVSIVAVSVSLGPRLDDVIVSIVAVSV